MSKFTHLPHFIEFFGVDLRSSEKLRAPGFSPDGTKNIALTPQGGLTCRPGSKYIGITPYGGLGIFAFEQVNILGVTVKEIIGFGADTAANSAKPYRLVASTFTLTNNHASAAATVSHYYDTATSDFRFKIVRSAATLINQDLDIGTEGSPYMLSSLETAVDLLTSFAMSTPTNGTTTPAAFMQLMNGETVAAAGGTLTVTYWYWEAVNFNNAATSTCTGILHYAYELGLDSFRNVSAVLLNGCLYVSWGAVTGGTINGNAPKENPTIWKYDGQKFYRPGLPLMSPPGSVPDAGVGSHSGPQGTIAYGSTLVSGHRWKVRLVFIDKAGNRIEGDLSDPSDVSSGAAGVWDLDNGGVATTQSNGNRALCNGGGTSLTQVTDAGNNMQVGDIAYFYDSGQARWIQRAVTASSSTSITFSATSLDTDSVSDNYDTGATPVVLDNALITANMRIEIWRTKVGGTAYYFRDEVAYHSILAPNYYDAGSDDLLSDALIEPVYPRSFRTSAGLDRQYNAPAGRYMAVFNTLLLVAGNDQRPNTVFFSDVDGCEYFPQGTHSFDLPARVTALAQCGETLLVFTETETHEVVGDLAGFNFRVSKIADVGCTAHASIQTLEEGVIVWQSKKGPYISFGGRRIEPLGAKTYPDGSKVSRIEPFWTRIYPTTTSPQPCFKRATSTVLTKERLYILHVPFENPSTPGMDAIATATAAVTWVFDYGRGIWWQWDGWNAAGGMAVMDDTLYFMRRSGDAIAYDHMVARLSQVQRGLAKYNAADTGQYNYADHNLSITWVWRAHWEALKKPSLFKRFLRVRISSDETRAATSTAVALKTYVDYDTALLSTSDTLTWTTQKTLKPKIKSETCQAMMLELSQSGVYHAPMIITGYEIEAVANFRPEFKE